ncbi:hypothetical protein B0J18DRAFT_112868 [Chaetomium sp. MPI-SDFR-AT-0129]|nr:hypothetical protein B0J18DRAFT_112868 [Chaetomium sp. MPI-SDFR-AT-0129]
MRCIYQGIGAGVQLCAAIRLFLAAVEGTRATIYCYEQGSYSSWSGSLLTSAASADITAACRKTPGRRELRYGIEISSIYRGVTLKDYRRTIERTIVRLMGVVISDPVSIPNNHWDERQCRDKCIWPDGLPSH